MGVTDKVSGWLWNLRPDECNKVMACKLDQVGWVTGKHLLGRVGKFDLAMELIIMFFTS